MTVCDTAHTTTPQRAVNRVAAWDNQTIMQLIVIKYFNGTYCVNQGIEGDVLSNDWLQENVTSSSFQCLHHVWVLYLTSSPLLCSPSCPPTGSAPAITWPCPPVFPAPVISCNSWNVLHLCLVCDLLVRTVRWGALRKHILLHLYTYINIYLAYGCNFGISIQSNYDQRIQF